MVPRHQLRLCACANQSLVVNEDELGQLWEFGERQREAGEVSAGHVDVGQSRRVDEGVLVDLSERVVVDVQHHQTAAVVGEVQGGEGGDVVVLDVQVGEGGG